MLNDLNHCINCHKKHYWSYESFMAMPDKARQVLSILCQDCSEKFKDEGISFEKIDYLWGEAIRVLESRH